MSAGGYLDRIDENHLAAFRGPLIDWFVRHQRAMPWREPGPDGRRDPYRVWLSEVMLQQTRVDQAIPYFERFTEAFPTVEALADADLDDVLRHWEGLGYYSRARNLHRAAREVVVRYDARVPDSEQEVRSLPGVGPYTAAAILSLAYDAPLAVLDGNVIRVLTRIFAIAEDTRKSAVRRGLQDVASALLDERQPGRFNEAMMELGATLCTPRPACPRCPLEHVCEARQQGRQDMYPVSAKKPPVPHHDIAVAVIEDDDGRILIQQRPTDAMLGGLWEFPGGKVEPGEHPADACAREVREELGVEVSVGGALARIKHAYSHFRITLHAFSASGARGEIRHHAGQRVEWVEAARLADFAFPRANRRLIDILQERDRNPTLL